MTPHAAALSALVLCSLSCAAVPSPPAGCRAASPTSAVAVRVDIQPPSAVDEAALAAVLPEVVEVRRAIHAHPELGEREHVTAERIADWLRADGLEVRTGIGGTGVLGLLRGGRPGPVVAYRADMDALPVHEETGLAFASTRTDQ